MSVGDDDGSGKSDARRGRFKVTEQLETWSADETRRKARQAATHDRYTTDARPRSTDDGATSGRGTVERMSAVSLRPHDFTLEPTCFRLGIGVTEAVFTHQDLVAIAAVDPWPCFDVEWKHVGGRSIRRFQPRFPKDQAGFAESVDALFAKLSERFPHRVSDGWRAEPIVAWEVVSAFPGDEAPEPETRAGYRTNAREAPAEEVLARRGPSTGRETMLDWLASSPDYPFRQHPREIALTEAHVYVRRRDESIVRLPLSTFRTMRVNDDGDAVCIFGQNTMLLVPHRKDCPVMRRFEVSSPYAD